jgi:sugar phosphate isomerase/epimerase
MKIGAMNYPGAAVEAEIDWMASLGLDYLDLTLEPPGAASWEVDPRSIRSALEKRGLGVVGHTAYYLPIVSPMPGIRKAVLEEFRRCLKIFAEVGARWMNIHPDTEAPHHDAEFILEKNLEVLRGLLPLSRRLGVGLMIENLPHAFNSVNSLAFILDSLEEVGLHLDIGHANLNSGPGNAEALIRAYGARIRHVHLHDNKLGGADLHLPLGAGRIDVAAQVRALKRSGYDGTITLEVFSQDRHYLAHSMEVLRRLWSEA